MHLPELELSAYLGVFLRADAVEEVLDLVALRGLEAEVTDPLELYLIAHEELAFRVRIDPLAELDVLTDEGGLTAEEAGRVLGPAITPPTLRLRMEELAGQDGLAVRVTQVHDAVRTAQDPDAGGALGHPPALTASKQDDEHRAASEVGAADRAADPAVRRESGGPLVPRWAIVVFAVGLVTWLSIAVFSEEGQARFALLGINPVLLLLGVGGPILAGYAFLRAGDVLAEERSVVGGDAGTGSVEDVEPTADPDGGGDVDIEATGDDDVTVRILASEPSDERAGPSG